MGAVGGEKGEDEGREPEEEGKGSLWFTISFACARREGESQSLQS